MCISSDSGSSSESGSECLALTDPERPPLSIRTFRSLLEGLHSRSSIAAMTWKSGRTPYTGMSRTTIFDRKKKNHETTKKVPMRSMQDLFSSGNGEFDMGFFVLIYFYIFIVVLF